MRVIGKRKIRPVVERASGVLLEQGAVFNDEIHRLPTGTVTCFPKERARNNFDVWRSDLVRIRSF